MEKAATTIQNVLNKSDEKNLTGVLEVQQTTNKVILIIVAITSLLLTVLVLYRQEGIKYVLVILLLCFIASTALVASIRNKVWGYYLISIVGFLTAGVLTYLNPNHYSDLITLYNGVAIFVCSTQFGRKGYNFGSTVISLGIVTVYVLFPGDRYPHHIISSLLSPLVLGIIPVLLRRMSQAIQEARQEEQRAETLSMKNMEILQNVADTYKEKWAKQDIVPAKILEHKEDSESVTIYESPYGAGNE